MQEFSIHALLAESDHIVGGAGNNAIRFSIHALLAESDRLESIYSTSRFLFYPRSPCGERPLWFFAALKGREFSIHALLAESDQEIDNGHETSPYFSIHALLAESDAFSVAFVFGFGAFLSTLSLRRATPEGPAKLPKLIGFLSTLSLRRATKSTRQATQTCRVFYPRSPCGERPARSLSIV